MEQGEQGSWQHAALGIYAQGHALERTFWDVHETLDPSLFKILVWACLRACAPLLPTESRDAKKPTHFHASDAVQLQRE